MTLIDVPQGAEDVLGLGAYWRASFALAAAQGRWMVRGALLTILPLLSAGVACVSFAASGSDSQVEGGISIGLAMAWIVAVALGDRFRASLVEAAEAFALTVADDRSLPAPRAPALVHGAPGGQRRHG